MSEREQDFWNRVRLLLQCMQAGAPVDDVRHKLTELIGEFGVGEQDVATAFQMMGDLSGTEHGGSASDDRSPRDDPHG